MKKIQSPFFKRMARIYIKDRTVGWKPGKTAKRGWHTTKKWSSTVLSVTCHKPVFPYVLSIYIYNYTYINIYTSFFKVTLKFDSPI